MSIYIRPRRISRNTEIQGFQGWLLGKGNFHWQIRRFRGFIGLHQFQRLQRKLGLDDLLSNSAYKNAIYIRPRLPHFNGSDSQKHGKFYGFFQGLLLEKKALIGKFDNFRPLILTARNTENPKAFQEWLLEKGASIYKFDDFRRFVGLHQFRCLQ